MGLCPWFNKNVHPGSVERTKVEGTRPPQELTAEYSHATGPTGGRRRCDAADAARRIQGGASGVSQGNCNTCGLHVRTSNRPTP